MSDIERHYSVEATAELLGGMNPRTLYNWASQGKIQGSGANSFLAPFSSTNSSLRCSEMAVNSQL